MDRAKAVSKLRAARVGRLATVRPDGRPHVVPVVFALASGGDDRGRLRVYWVVDSKPKRSEELQRLRNIAAHPHAELVVDGYDERWDRLWWVRASGTSTAVDDPDERALALDALSETYRPYAAGRGDRGRPHRRLAGGAVTSIPTSSPPRPAHLLPKVVLGAGYRGVVSRDRWRIYSARVGDETA